MENKKTVKIFSYIILLIVVITLVLSFINSAFVPSFMLMLSLYLFSVSYLMYVNEKKNAMYLLFILGILLIFGSLIYTGMRIS